MNLVVGTQRVTADIAIGRSGQPCRIFCVHLVSGASASTLNLRNGTSASGTIQAQIDGTALRSATVSFAGGMLFPLGCFADVDANISFASVVATNEQ